MVEEEIGERFTIELLLYLNNIQDFALEIDVCSLPISLFYENP